MKLKLYILFVVCVMAGCINSAFALGSGTKAIGNFFLKNGNQLNEIEFELPMESDQQVKIKIDGEKQMLEADSIDCIILWNKKYPDDQHLFKPFIAEYVDLETGEITGLAKNYVWLCCDKIGDNASIWAEIGRPTFKKGNLRFNFRSWVSTNSLEYVLKKGKVNPAYKPDKTGDIRKWVKVYFKDDPELIRRFEAGEYDETYDVWGHKYISMKRIVSDYSPR